MKTCAVEGCDEAVRTRGWCRTHYTRWKRHGDVHKALPVGRPRGCAAPSGRDLAIAEARRAGATLKAIADQYGLTHERVRQILKRTPAENEAAVKRVNSDRGRAAAAAAGRATRSLRSRQLEREVAALHAAGLPRREIAQRVGLSTGGISGILKRLGLGTPRPSYAARDQAIVEAYRAGVLLEQICKAHRVFPTGVYSVLRRNGVQFRRPKLSRTRSPKGA